MCGIVGVLTTSKKTYNSPTSSFFQQALFVDTMRGFDSTGVACLATGMSKPDVFKKALSAPDFLQLGPTIGLLDEHNAWNVLIGHNRAATKGGVKDYTSHPFQKGDVTLVHNGTLIRHNNLHQGSLYAVDSEAIANSIDKVGVSETATKMDGAFSLVWHDAHDDTVHFLRNKERPMYIGIVEGGDDILFGSESGMLQWLAHRNGFKLEKVFQPAVGVHYSYQVGVGKHWATTPKIETLSLYAEDWYKGYQSGKKAPATETATTITTAVMTKMDLGGEKDVTFVPDRFQPYLHSKGTKPETRFGQIYGTLAGETREHEVVIYNVSEAIYDTMDDQFIIGTVQNAFLRDGTLPVIVVNKLDWISYDIEGLVKEDEEDEEALDTAKKLYKGPRGTYIDLHKFDRVTRDGCALCQCDIDEEEAETLSWTADSQPVCDYCSEHYGWNAGTIN